MEYRYKCTGCDELFIIDRPMGDNIPQTLKSHTHIAFACPKHVLRKILEKPNLNNVNRFGTRSPRDRRGKH